MLSRLKEEILMQEEAEFQAFALENMLSEEASDEEIEAMMADDLEDEEMMNESSDLDVYQDGDLSEDVSISELSDNSEEAFLESVEEEMREGGFYSEDEELYSEEKEDKEEADSGILPKEDADPEDDDLSEDFTIPTFSSEEDSNLSEDIITLLEDEDFDF